MFHGRARKDLCLPSLWAGSPRDKIRTWDTCLLQQAYGEEGREKMKKRTNFSSFEDIIQFAIQREEEAAQGYGEMMAMAESHGLKKLLQELQDDEKNHKELLQDLKLEKIESLQPKKVTDLKISDYIVEEPLDADMSFQDLLIFAAKKEQKAVKLYSELARKPDKKDQKKLFEFMVEQEKSHKLKLETEYEKNILQED